MLGCDRCSCMHQLPEDLKRGNESNLEHSIVTADSAHSSSDEVCYKIGIRGSCVRIVLTYAPQNLQFVSQHDSKQRPVAN